MGKRRSANRGWRSKMNKHLEQNPDLQAQVTAIRTDQLNRQLEGLAEAQTAVSEQIEAVQSQMAELQGETAPTSEPTA